MQFWYWILLDLSLTAEVHLHNGKLFAAELQISAFFLPSNIQKGRLLYIRPVGRSVGWLVGWSVDVTINFFQYIKA